MRIATIAAMALLLAGCDAGTGSEDLAKIAEAGTTVRARLAEPGSAQFRAVQPFDGGDAPAVCGEVNASVGMGRTGYERFVVTGGKATIASDLPTDAAMTALQARYCR